MSVVELPFSAIERSFQFYLVDQTAAESADFRSHGQVFGEIAARGVFSDTDVPDRIDAFRSAHRARIYYDLDPPGPQFSGWYARVVGSRASLRCDVRGCALAV